MSEAVFIPCLSCGNPMPVGPEHHGENVSCERCEAAHRVEVHTMPAGHPRYYYWSLYEPPKVVFPPDNDYDGAVGEADEVAITESQRQGFRIQHLEHLLYRAAQELNNLGVASPDGEMVEILMFAKPAEETK